MGPELFTPTHLIFLAILGLLVFGPKRLPEIGRSLGMGLREFKSTIGGVTGMTDVNNALNQPAAASPPVAPTAAVVAPTPLHPTAAQPEPGTREPTVSPDQPPA
jgi:sec-independent protein translocase protein TatA